MLLKYTKAKTLQILYIVFFGHCYSNNLSTIYIIFFIYTRYCLQMQDGDGRHPGPVHPPAGQGGRVQVGGLRVQRGRPEVQHWGHQDTGQCRQSAMMTRVDQS